MSVREKNFDERLSPVDGRTQQALRLAWGPGDGAELSADMVMRQPTMLAAINLCVQASGLEGTKIARQLGLDKAHWSKILGGTAHFPPNLLAPLMELCGNHAPLLWLVHAAGFDPTQLHPLRSELEKKLQATQAALDASEREKTIMVELLRKIKAV